MGRFNVQPTGRTGFGNPRVLLSPSLGYIFVIDDDPLINHFVEFFYA